MTNSQASPRQLVRQGAMDTLPLILAAVPFGMLYGVLAKASGLSSWATMGMSVLVFAGSAQFIAVSMIAASVAWPAILLTTFFVNLRHMLYSATLVPHVAQYSNLIRARMAFWLTDETFAVVANWLRNNENKEGLQWYYLGSGLLMYGNWLLCTWVGLTLGQSLPGMENWGLEVAMVVAFVGIIAPALNNLPMIITALIASTSAVLTWGWPNQSGLILSAIIGVIAGVVSEKATDNE